MKIQVEAISEKLQDNIISYMDKPEDLLFFDIESTGLSPKSASVYLIGCAAQEGGEWVLRQWFAESAAEEKEVLEAFLRYVWQWDEPRRWNEPRRKDEPRQKDGPGHSGGLVHFNGTTFDIPFLQTRCRKYGLDSFLPDMEQTDIYRCISPLKNVLKLSNCKQKTLEEYLGIFREDPFNGGQLIELYREYTGSRDERLLKVLLLHNADDIRGMLSLLPVLSYPGLFNGRLQVSEAKTFSATDYAGNGQKELLIRMNLSSALPVPLSLHADGCFFSGHGADGLLKIPVICEEMKYFYPDYKNYSYLPDQDNAIHKSVAIYVDKAHRVPATPETCYTRKEGEFVLYPPACGRRKNASGSEADGPVFRREAKAKEGYVLLDDTFMEDLSRVGAYACSVLSHMQSACTGGSGTGSRRK